MEIIKCKLIILPKPTRKHWYFFLFLLGSFFRVFFPDLLDKNNEKDKDKDSLLTEKYFEILRNISSDLIIGIFHCIDKIKNRNESKKTNNKNTQKMYYLYNDESNKPQKKYIIIFIISFIDIICQLLIPIYILIRLQLLSKKQINDKSPSELYFLLFFDIFARYLFSRMILKTYFYIHHYLSFLLNIIGLIPITIVYILEEENFDFFYVSVVAIQTILYSLEDIMNKVAFRTLYMLPNY